MKRYAQLGILKPEYIEKYKKLHASVWPEVAAILTKGNIHNYSIYISGTSVFQYFEYTGTDLAEDSAKMAAEPVNQKWQAETGPCFEKFYVDAEEVFHLN